MHNKDLARSFMFMWDMMIITRTDYSYPITTYQEYRDVARYLFRQLFNRDMDYPHEIELGRCGGAGGLT